MIRRLYRYCSGKTYVGGHFDEDFGAFDVECPVCGAMDNNCANRRGLCLNCYSALANQIGEDAFAAMDMAALVRRGTAAALAAIRRGTYTIEQRNRLAIARFAAAHAVAPPKPIVTAPPKEQTDTARHTAAEESRDRVAKYGSGFKADEKAARREANRRAVRRYYAANRERILAAKRGGKTEAEREYHRRWKAAHKDKVAAYMREYNEQHRDVINARRRVRYAERKRGNNNIKESEK